jgi:hypothetical protein
MDYGKTLFCGITAAAIVCIAGCATPNLQPFAQQTARLADAVSGEQRQIASKFETVVDLYGKACERESEQVKIKVRPAGDTASCGQRDLRESERQSFQKSREAIDAIFAKTVVYATTLADLAAAGETGADAAKSLAGTLDKFASLAGMGGPLVSATVNTVLTKVAAAVTRVEAQKSLRDATATAQRAIDAIGDGVKEIRKAEETIVNALYNDELTAAERIAGPDLLLLYQDATIGRSAVNDRLVQRAAALATLSGCGPEVQPGSAARTTCDDLRGDLRNADELGRLLERLRPDYEAYAARRTAAVRWRAERRENLQAVANAADGWKTEHQRVADQLQRCGGLRATRCAELDAGSLKVLIDQINEIRSSKEK